MTKKSMIGIAAGITGAAFLVAAAALPTFVQDSVVGLPTELDETTVVVGTGELLDRASFFAPTPVRTTKDVPVSITARTISAESADSSAAVIRGSLLGARADATGDQAVFINTTDVVQVDRHNYLVSGTPVPTWTGPPAPPAQEPARIGTQFSFTGDVRKTDHQFYELMAHTPTTARYIDDDRSIDGIRLYHFRSELAPVDMTRTVGITQQTQLTLPAAKWGLPGGMEMVTMNQFYANVRDMWVEPTTGATVDMVTSPQIYYARSADDSHRVTAFAGELRFDQSTLDSLLGDAKHGRTMIRGLFVWLPIGLAVVGLLLVGSAVLIGVRGRARHPANSAG